MNKLKSNHDFDVFGFQAVGALLTTEIVDCGVTHAQHVKLMFPHCDVNT